MKKSSYENYTHNKSSNNTNSFTRKLSTGSTSSTNNNNVDNIMDVPNMEDTNTSTPLSIDVELEATDRYLQKVNEQQRRESLRLSHNSRRVEDNYLILLLAGQVVVYPLDNYQIVADQVAVDDRVNEIAVC